MFLVSVRDYEVSKDSRSRADWAGLLTSNLFAVLTLNCVDFFSIYLQPNEMIIPTTETVRQRYFLELFLSHEKPLLLVGPTGTGKSAITNNYILRMPAEK